MNTEELKYYLHESIENINNKETLQIIKEMIQHLFSNDEIPDLTDTQKRRITESKYQIANGKWTSHEQVNEQINKWLKK